MAKKDDLIFKRLRIFNAVMGGVHLVQVFLILHLSNNFKLPITYNVPTYDIATNTITPITETLADVRIGPLVAIFFFWFSIKRIFVK